MTRNRSPMRARSMSAAHNLLIALVTIALIGHWGQHVAAQTTEQLAHKTQKLSENIVPFQLSALMFDEFHNVTTEIHGDCPSTNGLISAQHNHGMKDDACEALGPCHIAFTEPGEYLAYNFNLPLDQHVMSTEEGPVVFVDITVRVASRHSKKFQLEVFHERQAGVSDDFLSPAEGFFEFRDITWSFVPLEAVEKHDLVVRFTEGFVNLCSVRIERSRFSPSNAPNQNLVLKAAESKPIAETMKNHPGSCNEGSPGSAAASTAHTAVDETCIHRDGSACFLELAEPGEYLEYSFYVALDDDEDFDIWFRVATDTPNSMLRAELVPLGSTTVGATVEVPALSSWNEYSDVVWESLFLEAGVYILRIHLDAGRTNLCSVTVKPTSSRYDLPAPGLYSALTYLSSVELSNEAQNGDCPWDDRWIDEFRQIETMGSLSVQHPICTDGVETLGIRGTSRVGACAIGWTQRGESVVYSIVTDGVHEYIDLSFGLSSHSAARQVEVSVDGRRGTPRTTKTYTLDSPGKGYDDYEMATIRKVRIGEFTHHYLQVRFIDGRVNMCTVGYQYSETSS